MLFSAATASIGIAGAPGTAAARYATLPVGSVLPGEAACAGPVNADGNNVELRPDNYTANHTTPARANGGSYPTYAYARSGISSGWFARRDAVGVAYIDRVNKAAYTGTTTHILRWASCKWGLDEDIQKARAVEESWWHQGQLGDKSYSTSVCNWYHLSTPCWTSYGLLQQKPYYHDGWNPPVVQRSTPYHVAYSLAWQRACLDGVMTWLGNGYHAGDVWGCVGAWYSGSWHDAAAEAYVARVKQHLADRAWTKPGF